MLNIVATPIGNLEDITLRSLKMLQSVDGIITEDTRRTSILLNHYQIKKPLYVLNDFNEARELERLIEKLKLGQNLALVSDAGTPLISDPGFKLVRRCIEENIEIDSLPGPTSIIPALTLSGLPPDKFMFIGFLPKKPSHRLEMLKNLQAVGEKIKNTFIVFESPYRLIDTLEEINQSYGDIEVVICKELTKIHQKIIRKKVSEVLFDLKQGKQKGEFIILFTLGL